jgi:hypothetical protein
LNYLFSVPEASKAIKERVERELADGGGFTYSVSIGYKDEAGKLSGMIELPINTESELHCNVSLKRARMLADFLGCNVSVVAIADYDAITMVIEDGSKVEAHAYNVADNKLVPLPEATDIAERVHILSCNRKCISYMDAVVRRSDKLVELKNGISLELAAVTVH